MTNDLRIINLIYKPNKYTIKGKVKILHCDDQDIVIKPKCKNLRDTFNYLSLRGFNNYAPLIDDSRKDYDVFLYVPHEDIPKEQNVKNFARVVSLLHAKTSYNKVVDLSVFDAIYYDILNNCEYTEKFYSDLYDNICLYKYHKPHEILFLDYYSKINNAIGFCKKELEVWYNQVSDKKEQRVSFIHNNLKMDHFLKNSNEYLISFDNSRFDTPVIDLVKLYKNEYNNINFSFFLDSYLYHFNYNEDELKLFFILISMPYEIDINENNFHNVSLVYNLCNYINKTEELVRPYYSSNEEKE